MDQAAREGGADVTAATDDGGQKSPEQLREEIAQTREQLGDTVEALAAKTDVTAQVKDRVVSVKDTAQHKKDEFVNAAKDATPESASAGTRQVATTVKDKPLPFAAGSALAAGLLIGWLLGRR